MPTTTLKSLYLASCLEELNKQTNINVADKPLIVKCNSARKLFTVAETSRKEGDEERAYVLYMKYWNVIKSIRTMPEFKKDNKYYDDMLGKQNLIDSINHAENLQKSLKTRYELLQEEKQKLREEEIILAELEQKKKASLEENDTIHSKEKVLSVDSNVKNNNIFNEYISCTQLYDLMGDNTKTILIIDARSDDDFQTSHIFHKSCFNISENIIKPGVTAVTVEKQLTPSILKFWKTRDKVDYIILYHWSDSEDTLKTLKLAMTKWDTRVNFKHDPITLSGGFDNWCLHYPMITSDPAKLRKPKIIPENDVIGKFLDFSYPEIDDILNSNSPTTTTLSTSNSGSLTDKISHPGFDRTNKPLINSIDKIVDKSRTRESSEGPIVNGLHSSTPHVNRELKPKLSVTSEADSDVIESTQQMQDNLAEQERVVNECLTIEKQRLEKEQQYHDLVSQKEECSNLQSKEELLLEKIRQLELEKKAKQEEEEKYREENEKIRLKLVKVLKEREEDTKKFEEEKEQIRTKMDEKLKLERQVDKLRRDRKRREKEREQSSNLQLKQETNSRREFNFSHSERSISTDSYHSPHMQQFKIKPDSSAGDTYICKLKDEPSSSESQSTLTKRPSLTRSHSSPNIAQMMAGEDEGNLTLDNKTPQFDRTIKPFTKTERKSSQQQDDYSLARLRNLMPLYGNQGRALTGLKNLGNTCFMNSIIQCLAQTTALASFFIQGSYRDHINRTNPLGHHGELAEEFAVVIRALWTGQYRSITPRDFKNTVSKYHRMFEGNDQQDSQEFLVFLMDGLHEDLNEVKIRPPLQPFDNDKMAVAEAAERAWEAHKQHNQSLIVNLFQGQYKSTVTCLYCGKESITFDTFMYLSLPIPPGVNRCSLKDCLQLFVKEERMTGASKWLCPKCGEKREADKKMDIWKLPRVLLIHLKRFSYEGMWRRKLQTYVDFPLSNLNLEKYVLDPKKRFADYALYAVSNHYGTMEGGHYTAFCKNPEYDKWYKFDDHEVSEMSSADVKSSAAYILFYTSGILRVPQVYD